MNLSYSVSLDFYLTFCVNLFLTTNLIAQAVSPVLFHISPFLWASAPSMFILTNGFLFPASHKMTFLLFYSPTSHLPTLGLNDPHTHPPPKALHLLVLCHPQSCPCHGSLLPSYECAQDSSSLSKQSEIISKKTFPSTQPHFFLFPSRSSFATPVSLLLYSPSNENMSPRSQACSKIRPYDLQTVFILSERPAAFNSVAQLFLQKHFPMASSVAPWPRLPSASLGGPVSSSHLNTLHVGGSSSTDWLLPIS